MTCAEPASCLLGATVEPASALWPPVIEDPHHVAACDEPADVEASPLCDVCDEPMDPSQSDGRVYICEDCTDVEAAHVENFGPYL